MTRFAVLTLLGLSSLCAICSIHLASAQSSHRIDVDELADVLNTISSSESTSGSISEGSSQPSLLNINLLVQLLNGLLAGGDSGPVSRSTLTDMCNQASTPPPPSSRSNTDSLIAIRILVQILNTIANATRRGSNNNASLLNVSVIIDLLNSIARSNSSSGGRNTKPLIGIDVLLQALNSYKALRNGGGGRYCHIGQLNQLLQSEANNAGGNSGGGSVLDAEDVLPILNRVIYPSTLNSARNNNLIRVNVLINALNQLLGGSRSRRRINTGNNALVSLDVCISLLNNTSKNNHGLVGLVLNLLQGLLGQGAVGGLLNGLLGGILG